jgi:hypothetical protein
MKKAWPALLVLLAATASCALVAAAKARVAERAQRSEPGIVIQVISISTQQPAAVLKRVKEVLVNVTKVPLRWPAFISTDINEAHPLYVNLVSESAADYKVELGWTEDCIGGSYCHYGTVRGSTAAISESDGAAVPVTLREGIAGYFIEVKCGATRCNDAAVGWSEGEYHYLVSMKNGKKSDLIKIANSALSSAHRPVR